MRGLGSNSSTVDFGEPQPRKMMNAGFNIKTINLGFYDDFFWSASISAYAITATGGSSSYQLSSEVYAYFDSASSQILVPPSMYTKFITDIVTASGGT